MSLHVQPLAKSSSDDYKRFIAVMICDVGNNRIDSLIFTPVVVAVERGH
jgi:hypothetical protein